MEYLENDLRVVFSNIESNMFTEEHAQIISYNILCGLKFLKSANVVHRDIKPANILINDQCNVRICDFGLARTLPFYIPELDTRKSVGSKMAITSGTHRNRRECSPEVGTRWYRPPEVILRQTNYDFQTDAWSFGCIFGELVQKM